MKVLQQNRSNVFTHRGGDTIVMERVAAGLRASGVTVDFDSTGNAPLKNYDIINLFNFALPEMVEEFSRRAVAAGVPYVITSLYEDWPSFYNPMQSIFTALEAYINAGQPSGHWDELRVAALSVPAHEPLNNLFAAQHAARLLVTGEREAAAIRRDFPGAAATSSCFLGCDITPFGEPREKVAEEFIRATGLCDFVLCVGRLETRKNQLMLLKALEESDLPVVFATGGFTYQPAYEASCRAFKRKGRTFFLGRQSPELLRSMFAAARVHALPSWYELPGLVSLEAAAYGAQVVATDLGTLRDYLGDQAFYANPGDDSSILNAVTAAYYSPPRPGLLDAAQRFTWERTAAATLECYRDVVGSTSPR